MCILHYALCLLQCRGSASGSGSQELVDRVDAFLSVIGHDPDVPYQASKKPSSFVDLTHLFDDEHRQRRTKDHIAADDLMGRLRAAAGVQLPGRVEPLQTFAGRLDLLGRQLADKGLAHVGLRVLCVIAVSLLCMQTLQMSTHLRMRVGVNRSRNNRPRRIEIRRHGHHR